MTALLQNAKHPFTTWVSYLAISRATLSRLTISYRVERQNFPLSSVSGQLFFSLVVNVCPERIQLATLDPELSHQHSFELPEMSGSSA